MICENCKVLIIAFPEELKQMRFDTLSSNDTSSMSAVNLICRFLHLEDIIIHE